MYQNARSLKSITRDNNELANLKNLLLTEKPDILTIVETWLDTKVSDSELNIEGYDFFRRDRNSKGGGIIVYYKKDIVCKWKQDLTKDLEQFNEILVCEGK